MQDECNWPVDYFQDGEYCDGDVVQDDVDGPADPEKDGERSGEILVHCGRLAGGGWTGTPWCDWPAIPIVDGAQVSLFSSRKFNGKHGSPVVVLDEIWARDAAFHMLMRSMSGT